MRRERREFRRKRLDIKRVLYIAFGIILLAIIAFFAITILNIGNQNGTAQLAKFNTSIIDDYIANNNSITETSSEMGKTINEVKEEVVIEDSKEKQNSQNENNGIVSENKKNTTEDDKVETNKVEETVKDPEFKIPVEGEIIRKYAKENLVYSTTLDEWVVHNGIDIKAEKTEIVKASADGVVKSIKNDPRYGLTVVLEHVNGFTTVYSNLLTAEFIEEGENIKQGQTIATVGNTATFEIADEPHLHFEILKENEALDPELYIK